MYGERSAWKSEGVFFGVGVGRWRGDGRGDIRHETSVLCLLRGGRGDVRQE